MEIAWASRGAGSIDATVDRLEGVIIGLLRRTGRGPDDGILLGAELHVVARAAERCLYGVES